MNKYLVVPSNTDLNRGDQALIWETVRLLEEVDQGAEIKIILSGNDKENIEMQSRQTREKGFLFTSSLMEHPGRAGGKSKNQYYSKIQFVQWSLRAIRDLAPRLLLLSKIEIVNKIGFKFLSKEFIETYNFLKECNSIIFKGGGYIHSYGASSDPYHMFYYLFYSLLAKRHNVQVVFMPNSFGPFNNKFAKKIVKNVLRNVDLITVRENVSKVSLAEELSVKSEFYPDLGFFMVADSSFDVNEYLENLNIKNDRKKIGITVRPYRFDGESNPKELYENYLNTFKDFINYLYENNYEPYLIAQTMGPSYNENDNEAIKGILHILKIKDVNVISDYDLNANQIKKIYEQMDYVIGTRFHSVIFSISSNVPSIAISYGGNKGKGIMEELGLSEYEIAINEISLEKLIFTFENMVEKTDEYKIIIENKMLEYNKLRTKLIYKMKSKLI